MVTRSAIADMHAAGSAREGVGHWKQQRLTALANIPLVLWFILSVLSLADGGYEDARAWLASPVNAALMILFILSTYWHARLGVQVVIEDYVHGRAIKIASLVALNLVVIAMGVASIIAVLKVSLGS
jgi:succinate dehydrogenase / fumarate reductase membrane anchor subunit